MERSESPVPQIALHVKLKGDRVCQMVALVVCGGQLRYGFRSDEEQCGMESR